jgi:hypothetical protein
MRRLVAVATLAALVAASAALAASPQSLILQKSDMPRGAKKLPLNLGKNGTFNIPKAGHVRVAAALYYAAKQYVGTAAGLFDSSSAATRAYARIGKLPATYEKVDLPSLGDKQRAVGTFSSRVSSVVVLVQKGPVIWETAYTVAGKKRRSAVISSALSYARKQKARVG